MSQKTLRIATRNSPLALWQANHIREMLLQLWPNLRVDLVPMVTSGDKFLKDKLMAIGGKGLFVKELEEALLKKQADFAVHSMKDVPAEFPEGLSLMAICKRESPLDALVSNNYTSLNSLPEGATVGTASLRRQSQLLAIRPDLIVQSLRGNINTRIEKLEAREFDAIILAAAGLKRMGLQANIREMLDEDIMLPACGQGALGIECRTDDEEMKALIAPLNDPLSALCVHTERHVNARLGGNCHVPLAVFCSPLAGSEILLRARVMKVDGSIMIVDKQQGLQQESMALADKCAQNLLAQGANDLLALDASS